MSDLTPEEFADGFALWQEHRPQSGEDWVAVAGRCFAAGEEGLNGSPLFRALMIQTVEVDRYREALRQILDITNSAMSSEAKVGGANFHALDALGERNE